MNEHEMRVTKRGGQQETVSFDKILTRIRNLGQMEPEVKVNFPALVMKVIEQIYDGISTSSIDEIMAQECASMVSTHPDYHVLAGRIVVSNHHQKTGLGGGGGGDSDSGGIFFELHRKQVLADSFYETYTKHRDFFTGLCDYSRDYLIDYFGFKTLEKSYLLRAGGCSMERPQDLFLRVAIAIHGEDLARVRTTYDAMSLKEFIHATPTLFNAGTKNPQLSSCYLLGIEADSVEGIYNTVKDCAMISKWSGGIGLHIHEVRAAGSHIRGTNGASNGIVPMLKVFNQTAKFINQGGKRNGSVAVYMEPWHLDVEMFLQMRKNHGDEELKARDLFYALWIPDLFMRRVKEDGSWTLFCPASFPNLAKVYGADFDRLYASYEEGEAGAGGRRRTMKARDLWFQILDAQMETGTPYLLYKDSCNSKSNQKNVGVIQSSNLCTEIVQYSDPGETAVCNLASIALPSFVMCGGQFFNFQKLHDAVRLVTYNLNRIIDINFYPTDKTRCSNLRHRPIGIGVQGLADVFMMMNMSFLSAAARQLNKDIFEVMYHAALCESCELAEEYGPYESFAGSPASLGKLQFDLWREAEAEGGGAEENAAAAAAAGSFYGADEWADLKSRIMRHGLRNSLLVAPMPTASTSQILGFNECFEPFTSNIYSRRTMAGEFILANKYLMKDLLALDLWTEELKNDIILHNGSVQHLACLSGELKEKYKTVWEIPMRGIIDMSVDRAHFICQSQSLNLWLEDPSYKSLTSMHMYAWSKGLKTGMYYLRRRARYQVQKFSIQAAAAASSTSSTSSTPATTATTAAAATDVEQKEEGSECVSCSA